MGVCERLHADHNVERWLNRNEVPKPQDEEPTINELLARTQVLVNELQGLIIDLRIRVESL